MPTRLLIGLAILTSTAVGAPAQRTIIVTGGGNAMQSAIAIANPGDTLDVWPATYDAFTVSKGINIRCRPGVMFQGGAGTKILAIPAGETLNMRGGSFDRPVGLEFALTVDGCAGTVIVDEPVRFWSIFACQVEGCSGTVVLNRIPRLATNGWSRIRGSSHVSLTACELTASLLVAQSNVSLVDTSILQGLAIESGRVAIAGGLIHGRWQFSGAQGEPSIILQAGELTIAGHTTLQARPAFGQPVPPAIESFGGSIRLGPNVTMLAATPPIVGPATVDLLPVPSAHALGVPAGQVFTVDVEAEPGSLTATLLGLPMPVIPTPFGELWLAPTSPVLDLTMIPASGTRTLSSEHPVPPGFPLVLQPLSLTVSGQLIVGTPARVVMQ